MPLLNDLSRERYEQSVNEPFRPPNSVATRSGLESDPALRIAHALEYIAAQVGQINAKIERETTLDQLLTRAETPTSPRGFD
jgi:hypothetical protein